jgi:hypothetical protein
LADEGAEKMLAHQSGTPKSCKMIASANQRPNLAMHGLQKDMFLAHSKPLE